MKLYYSPGACSLASHIVLEELGSPYTVEAVDLKTKTFKGGDFNKINPNGYVPTLALDNGQILTENVAILAYLADQKPEAKLLPPAGSFERYRGLEWLAYISTELHKSFAPLLKGGSEAEKTQAKEKLHKRFSTVDQTLRSSPYLLGPQFSAPDAYLFVMTTWAAKIGLELTPEVLSFAERIKQRPAVQAVLKAEAAAKH